ncbi:TonB-dependent receptor [Chryseolinea sp. H1M3-3]|uniref:TonB-dependent receptor n=1 Tax=Chryseolinea sp. H1M3-3 TaxID=3034144 RepID=UPI0023ED88E7|nr:TonB-dependent receptor [Chryseolinea sp. H1M3-3]
MNIFYRVLALFSLLFAPMLTLAQAPRVTGSFNGTAFQKFVEEIESKTSYHFYFNPAHTDSLTVTASPENQALDELLNQVLAGTGLHHAIDLDHNVYISKEREILSDLPDDFFGTGVSTPGRPAIAFDYTLYEKREKQRKLAETRLYSIGVKTSNLDGKASLAGYVRDAASGSPVIGAAVYVENPMIGVATDGFGYYSITLPKGRHELKIQSIGMKSTERQIMLYSDGNLNIELDEEVTPLKEVVVQSERDVRVRGLQMGVEKMDIKTMKQMPLALGETDIMKVVLTLPGVQTVGEGTVGLNIRGGATNQNLILFNDATIYNPSHLFGFFSTFNPDVLNNVELYKSGITAEYGGRLSAVLDVTSREGNLKKFAGSGGISPITGRLSLEGPIIKDKFSFLIGGRSTYSDWILGKLKTKSLQNSEASFYDLNIHLSYKVNDKNNVYVSGYMSKDKFKLNSDTLYNYSDKNLSLKWKHVFNNKLYGVLTSGYSNYSYSITSDINPVEAFNMKFAIQQTNAKLDLSYFPNTKHTILMGLGTIRYKLSPGNMQPFGETSIVTPDKLQNEQALESSLYVGDQFELSQKLGLYAGIRYSFYQFLGPKDVYTYGAGQPRELSSMLDTIQYASGKTIASHHGPEPRLSLRYSLSRNASVKISYNRMRQYIQMLSNTTAIAPTDIWKLSDNYIQPQIGDQYSFGFYKNLKGGLIEFSMEAYYKTMKNSVDFKNSAVLLLNHHIETDVVNATGNAYGIEFLLKKSAGKLNGWISYTYSRSLLKTQSIHSSETVNKGKYYPSSYDKPHAVNFIGNYKFSRRFNFSLNTTYSTGRPITLPLLKYDLGGNPRLFYSERNQFRIPDYFRLDVSINVEGNHRIKKLAHSSWTFAVYNLTGRQNAYSIYFTSKDNVIKGYKLSIFGRPIPTITYNFKF